MREMFLDHPHELARACLLHGTLKTHEYERYMNIIGMDMQKKMIRKTH
jgi:hypothetical protein